MSHTAKLPMALLCLAVAILVAPFAVAQDTARTHAITPEDYFTLATIQDMAPSPDGKYVAYVELRWDPPADRRTADLWVVEIRTGKRQRLTFDPAYDLDPQWSSDSRTVYFASGRRHTGETEPPYDGRRQVWRVSVEGGEPQAVTRVPGGIVHFDVATSGGALYYTRSKKHRDKPFLALRAKFPKLEYGHGMETFHTVWKLDLETWHEKKLVDDNRYIRFLKVAPDEKRIAMITDPDQHLITHEGAVPRGRVRRGFGPGGPRSRMRRGAPRRPRRMAGSRVLPGPRTAGRWPLTWDFDGYPGELFVAEWMDDGVHIHKIVRPDEVHIESGKYAWQGTSRTLCYLAHHRAVVRVHGLRSVSGRGQGERFVLTPERAVVSHFAFPGRSDVLVAAWANLTNPGDLFVVESPDHARQLTRLNPQVDTWKLPTIRKVTWKGANGAEVEGILELPPDYQKGQPLPTIVELHGGPTADTKFQFRFWIYGRALMAARGYALLSPNYRGSLGYGDAFLTDLIGRETYVEVEDILKGVDALVQEGIADPERLGVMGWSNGGLLTNCLITKTDRFKAASSGAGVFDMTLQWCEEDTPGHVINFMRGKLPWEVPAHYQKSSPVYAMDHVKTPTLIHVGGNDARVPLGHSRGLYRALSPLPERAHRAGDLSGRGPRAGHVQTTGWPR